MAAGVEFAGALGASLTIGIVGAQTRSRGRQRWQATAARVLAVAGEAFAQARYASDAAACEALCRAAEATLVLAPAVLALCPRDARRGAPAGRLYAIRTSRRWQKARRWRRRAGSIASAWRPCCGAKRVRGFCCWRRERARRGRLPPGTVQVETVAVTLPALRTTVTGVRAPKQDEQTIRPDAKLLFVAGAGWTKKQADGQVHAAEAETLILGFLRAADASLGSSKSLVDQSGENQAVLKFMTHLNQIGQTGATPRHPKGLSTCCHGEEPHVVGWRFITERRAVNLDPNCGWARGKADVLYVADAFKVMAKVNALLAERKQAGN